MSGLGALPIAGAVADDPARSGVVARWLALLAPLVFPMEPGRAMAAFAHYAAPLAEAFPPPAFTAQSLAAVACGKRDYGIPRYDEVHAPLAAWWREHRPHPKALPAPRMPDVAPPTAAEIAAVRSIVAGMTKGVAPAAPETQAAPPRRRTDDLALLQSYRARAASGRATEVDRQRLSELERAWVAEHGVKDRRAG